MQFPHKYFCFILILLGLATQTTAQETIWSENFDGQTDGLDNGNFGPLTSANGKWSIEVINQGGDWVGTSDYFKVNNDLMEARDTDNRCEWTSATIDISSFSNVTASVDLSQSGTFEVQDTLAVYYSVDGAALTAFTTNGVNVDDFGTLTASTSIPSGNNLQIVIHVKNNAGTELLRFDNVDVSGDSNVINPEPSAHVSDISITDELNDSFTVGWTDAATGNLPLAYLVKISSETISDPVDGTAEADGTLVLNIAQGVQTASFSSLNGATTYNVSIYPYSNTASNIDYKLGAAINQVTTLSDPDIVSIFISEIADPDNSVDGRYIELYNYSSSSIDLSGWKILRYTNANTEAGTPLNLSGTIGAYSTFVIGKSTFSSVYTSSPDMTSSNPAIDSNGDDNFELVNPDGIVIDTFGVPGEDGSGTNHEFEDGRAERNNGITAGNATYTVSEWTIDNDGGSGDGAIDAPAGYDPGSWVGGKTVVSITANTSENNYQIASNDFLSVSNNAELTITNGGQWDGEIVIESGSGITISSGTLNTTSSLTLRDGAYLLEDGGTVNNSGTFRVERTTTVDAAVYNYLSSPVANAALQTTLVDSDVLSYDPTDFVDDGMGNTDNITGWTYQTMGDLDVGRGYATTGSDTDNSGTRSFSGTPNSGNQLFGVFTSSGGSPFGESWNLTGNPYPSPIQIGDFLTTNTAVIENGVYLWDDSVDDYVTKNSGIHGTESIAIGQGFFVQAKSSTDIQYTDAMRRGTTATFFRKSQPLLLDVVLKDANEKKNFTTLAISPKAKDDKDAYFDSRKMFGNTQLSIYSLLNNEAYAIQGVSNEGSKEIPIGLRVANTGQFELSIQSNKVDADYLIFLEDKFLNTTTLVADNKIDVFLEEGIIEDRFVLQLKQARTASLEEFEELSYSLVNGIFSIENQDIEAVYVRDMTGRLLRSFTENHNNINDLPSGTYLLELYTEHSSKFIKVNIL